MEEGQQEKVVKNVMNGMREQRKNGVEAGQGSWSDEVDGEGERKERQDRGKGKDRKVDKTETVEIFKVQKVEKDGMVEKVENVEQFEQVEKAKKVEEGQKVQKVVSIKHVMNENEGMVKTLQILWDFRQSEVRDELNNDKTTENPDEMEEHWVELKRRTKTRMFRGKEEDGKSRRMVPICVKVDGARTGTMEMALSDKVNDIVERLPTSAC